LDEVLDRQLAALTNQPLRELLEVRTKVRKMGQFFDWELTDIRGL